MRRVAYVLEHNVYDGKGKTQETHEVGKRGKERRKELQGKNRSISFALLDRM